MKKNKTEKGITLVALIITIIVLLILAVVAIGVVTGDGILFHAKDASTKYAEKAEEENSTIEGYAEMIKEQTGGTTPGGDPQEKGPWTQDGLTVTNGTKILKVGEKVAYSAGTGKTASISGDLSGTGAVQNLTGIALEWRVLGANEKGQLELISNKPDETNQVQLKGETGWLNAEEVLDDVCNKMYGKGDKAASARSLKVEDINKLAGITTEEAIKSVNSSYGTRWEYKYSTDAGHMQYRKSTDSIGTADENRKWNPNWTNISSPTYQTFKEPGKEIIDKDHTGKVAKIDYTYYQYRISDKITNSTIANLITNGEDNSSNVNQWLSSLCVNASANYASFDVRRVNGGTVYGRILWDSNGNAYEPSYAIRPVVCLASNVQIGEKDANGVWQFK